MKYRTLSTFISLLFCLLCYHPTYAADQAERAHIAVASNFSHTLKQLLSEFNNDHQQVITSFSSSGKLYAQIINGAPYDAFLSADVSRVNKLIEEGFTGKDSDFIYAQGRLVLWTNNPKFFPVSQEQLRNKPIRVALANPKLAPYGLAAQQFLKQSGLDNLLSNAIQGENISQTYQFVASTNADFGLVAYSQILAKPHKVESWWLVPKNSHSPINQKAVLTRKGMQNSTAKAFLQFLRSQKAINIIEQNGYSVPHTPSQQR